MDQDEDTRLATRSASSHLDIPDPSDGVSPLSVKDMIARYRRALSTAKWGESILEYIAVRGNHSAGALAYADGPVKALARAFLNGTLATMTLPPADRDDAMMAYHIGTAALALSEFLTEDAVATLSDPVKCLRSSK
jgi:hypothetical protein